MSVRRTGTVQQAMGGCCSPVQPESAAALVFFSVPSVSPSRTVCCTGTYQYWYVLVHRASFVPVAAAAAAAAAAAPSKLLCVRIISIRV